MMSAFGDMQSLMALSTGVSQGLGIAKAGTMSALSLGSNVIGKGGNLISGGANKISNMLSKGKTLTSGQMDQVKESLTQHNPYQDQQQVNEFLKQNSNGKYSNANMNMSNSFMPYGMSYNPIHNQYSSSLQANNNNEIERKQ